MSWPYVDGEDFLYWFKRRPYGPATRLFACALRGGAPRSGLTASAHPTAPHSGCGRTGPMVQVACDPPVVTGAVTVPASASWPTGPWVTAMTNRAHQPRRLAAATIS